VFTGRYRRDKLSKTLQIAAKPGTLTPTSTENLRRTPLAKVSTGVVELSSASPDLNRSERA